MRLLDQVAQARGAVIVTHPETGRVQLPGAASFAAEVASITTRYVMMDDVTRACGVMIIDQPDLLGACIDLVRIPASGLWVEWANHRLHPDPAIADGQPPQRAGMLVNADESGRRGTIQSFWEDRAAGVERSPALLHFDLDAPPDDHVPAGCDPALAALLSRTAVAIEPAWATYYARATPDANACTAAELDVRKSAWKDFLILMSFTLMLSMRGELDFQPSTLTRLNEARRKRGKAALLDFVEVGASLFASTRAEVGGDSHGEGSGHRAGARVHHVRGHFVRRNQAIFWRRTHLRGDLARGVAPARITRLGMGRD